MARTLSREAIAYHETGHAVAMIALGVKVLDVTIDRPDGQLGGCTRHVPGLPPNNGQGIVISLAGPVAQLRRCPGSWLPDEYSPLSDDAKANKVIAYIAKVDGGDAKKMRAAAEQKAARLVADHWPEIERVAETLLKRGTLTGDQIMELLPGE